VTPPSRPTGRTPAQSPRPAGAPRPAQSPRLAGAPRPAQSPSLAQSPDPARSPGPARTPRSEKSSDPIVSVLVKSYNHANYIAQTIDSILAQSFQDFEIVVTDDASTDGTPDIVRRYRDPRIRLDVSPRNLGISGAMNATIARARGRYLAILNSDDWSLPGRLRLQADFLDARPDVSVVFGLPRIVDEHGNPTTSPVDFTQPPRFPDFSRRSWLRQFFFAGNCLCAPTAMMRREACQAAGPYDRRLTNLQDLDMWIRMLLAGHSIHVLPEEVTAFRIRANNANMSAPRPDTYLRGRFEATRILRHYAAFDRALFIEVFGEAGQPVPDAPPARLVAELAARDPRPEHQNFALDVLWHIARDDDDFDRLRVLAGSIDALGAGKIQRLQQAGEYNERAVALLTAALNALETRFGELTRENERLRDARADSATKSPSGHGSN
jgi:glycosyltransferase involved in cell wall biosynthesis